MEEDGPAKGHHDFHCSAICIQSRIRRRALAIELLTEMNGFRADDDVDHDDDDDDDCGCGCGCGCGCDCDDSN